MLLALILLLVNIAGISKENFRCVVGVGGRNE